MSSFFSPLFSIIGPIGPYGPIGNTGPIGNIGPTGSTGIGSTGNDIVSISLDNNNKIIHTYTSGTTFGSYNTIKGSRGVYLANIIGTTNNIISGWTLSRNITIRDDGYIVTNGSVLILKNINTTSSGITLSRDDYNNDIVLKYIKSIGNVDGPDNTLITTTTNSISGITGIFYNSNHKTLDIPIRSYYEKITNIESVVSSDASNVRWDIDLGSIYNTFQLLPRTDVCSTCQQHINFINIPALYSNGITLIIPSGITKDTKFISDDDIDNYLKLFPLGIDVKLSNNLDVINIISTMSTGLYGSFVLWNSISTDDPIIGITKDYYNNNLPNFGNIDCGVTFMPFTDFRVCGYPAPILTSIIPDFGSTGGGNFVKIVGANLQGATLTIGGITLSSVSDATGITFTTIAVDTSGPKPVIVYTPSGVGKGLTFTYYYSSITYVDPNRGPTGGG